MKNDDVKYRMKEINGVIVGKSNGKGEGLFAARPFEAGEIILSYDNWKLKGKKHFPDGDEHVDYQGRGKYVSSNHPYSYTNHSCDPNSYIKFRTIASGTVFAQRDIKEGEEITYDYAFIDMDGFGLNTERNFKILNCHFSF